MYCQVLLLLIHYLCIFLKYQNDNVSKIFLRKSFVIFQEAFWDAPKTEIQKLGFDIPKIQNIVTS